MSFTNSKNLLFILLTCWTFGCTVDTDPPPIAHAVEADFEEASEVSAQLAEGLELTLWAPGPLLSNAVALTFDPSGVAYVAETTRRKSSDLDIREHWDWMVEELALQSIEDTRAFHLKKLATELSDQNTWLEDFNRDSIRDYRDLEVQSEQIRRIWDSDGDGRADASQLFADGFNGMLTGVAAGILYDDGNIFLTAAPDVWRLRDVDNDGIADERESISHGYGIHIAFAGHDMSGLTMGPDGRIYWSIGDMGVNAVGPDGKRWPFPNQGAVMRANPDGTEFEVFAHGLRNPQELDFDAFGNLISVDNDGDHAGEHERYVHILEGSDSGWRINWQYGKYNKPNESYKVWMDEKLYLPYFPGQAAYILPALALAYDGPAGLAYNPGTALSQEWYDYFFASFFTGNSANSKIQAFKLSPKGASFEIAEIKDVAGGIVPTGITFAPDGALYINDWKDSYDKKPAGRIWRLDVVENYRNPGRKETQRLLQAGMTTRSIDDLTRLLAHKDRRVRMAAQFELVKKEEATALLRVAKGDVNLFAKLHAIWGVGQLARNNKKYAQAIVPLLKNPHGDIRAQTAKVVGDARYHPALNSLIDLLGDDYAPAQYFAAEALGKLAKKEALTPLIDLLESVGDSDPHLRHGIVYALSRLSQEEALGALSDHPSRDVRLGAVVALRIVRSPFVANFLDDRDLLVVTEAARAINDDLSIPEALLELARALERAEIHDEAFIRRAINANLRLGDAGSAGRLVEYATTESAPAEMRADALWALGYWPDPPLLDRVDGRYRKLEGHVAEVAQEAFAEAFLTMITDNDDAVKTGVVMAAGRLNYRDAAPPIYDLFVDKSQYREMRVAALIALAQLDSAKLLPAIDLALEDEDVAIRQEAQELLNQSDLPEDSRVSMFEKVLNNSSIPEKQRALLSLSSLTTPKAKEVLESWLDKLTTGQLPRELELDILTAIDSCSFEDLKSRKVDYENALNVAGLMGQYKMTLNGGDVDRGRRIFRRHEGAQCLRCHLTDGWGGEVGPELTNIASNLTRDELLLSLIDPDARIAPGYGTVSLAMKDGQTITGLLQGEDDHFLTLKTGKDTYRTIEKNKIAERENYPSGMFNMTGILSKSQIRDVMAYMTTLK